MVRPPSFDSNGMKKGAWSKEEDDILRAYVERFGHSNWRLLPLLAGLARCGKSCRLRWVNYLKPGLKRGMFTKHEEDRIIKLHAKLGNKWSIIAKDFPGRTDNEIKNYWHAHIDKRNKRKSDVTKAIRAETPQEEKSSEINYCTTTDHQNQPASENVFPDQGLSIENINAQNSVADSYSVAEPYQTCFNQLNDIYLHPFHDEEFHDFGCSNDMSTFSDSSDSGITSWNSSSTAQSQLGNFLSEQYEEDTFYMVLW